jgi:hypothetical protein
LVVPDRLRVDSPPSIPLVGQLRYSKRNGERFFLATFFEEKSEFSVSWPEGFFTGEGELKVADGKITFLGKEVKENDISFNWKKLPSAPTNNGILYGYLNNGRFYVQEIRPGQSALPSAIWTKLNKMIAQKDGVSRAKNSYLKSKSFVQKLVSNEKKKEDTDKMVSFIQKATEDNKDPNDKTAEILKNIVYFGGQ